MKLFFLTRLVQLSLSFPLVFASSTPHYLQQHILHGPDLLRKIASATTTLTPTVTSDHDDPPAPLLPPSFELPLSKMESSGAGTGSNPIFGNITIGYGSFVGQITTVTTKSTIATVATKSFTRMYGGALGPEFTIEGTYLVISNTDSSTSDFSGIQTGLGEKAACLDVTAMYPNRKIPAGAASPFAWIKYAKFNRTRIIESPTNATKTFCNEYVLHTELPAPFSETIDLSACLVKVLGPEASYDVPATFVSSITTGTSAAIVTTQEYDFEKVNLAPNPKDYRRESLEPKQGCDRDTDPTNFEDCTGDVTAVKKWKFKNLELVRFHPENDFAVGDKNFGDMLSDVGFICTKLMVDNSTESSVGWGESDSQVSLWEIDVLAASGTGSDKHKPPNSPWDVYAPCNAYGSPTGPSGPLNSNSYSIPACMGDNDKSTGWRVGRGLPFNSVIPKDHSAGRCDLDDGGLEIGFWYTLRESAKCSSSKTSSESLPKPGQVPTCSWREDTAKRIKTLSLKENGCLNTQYNMRELCLKGMNAEKQQDAFWEAKQALRDGFKNCKDERRGESDDSKEIYI